MKKNKKNREIKKIEKQIKAIKKQIICFFMAEENFLPYFVWNKLIIEEKGECFSFSYKKIRGFFKFEENSCKIYTTL